MHYSLAPFLDRVLRGYLRMVEHDDLVLFNYTDKCTFEKAWDQYTLMARGIIFKKETGAIVASPFGKFFNYEEYPSRLAILIFQPHYIQEKMDGSLGIIYWHKNEWNIATRGSFNSDQAIRGREILKKYDLRGLSIDWTVLVEIIYPENKIIVPYGDEEKLVLLAIRDITDGTYLNEDLLHYFGASMGMPVAQSHLMTVLEALERQSKIPYTEEGWVVVFEDGNRVKIKGKDYMRIAKFKANMSPISVWESMVESPEKFHNMKVACPEELLTEFNQIAGNLTTQFLEICAIVVKEMMKNSWNLGEWQSNRKATAIMIKKYPNWVQPILFGWLSKGDWNENYIWKLIRPTNNQFFDINTLESFPSAPS